MHCGTHRHPVADGRCLVRPAASSALPLFQDTFTVRGGSFRHSVSGRPVLNAAAICLVGQGRGDNAVCGIGQSRFPVDQCRTEYIGKRRWWLPFSLIKITLIACQDRLCGTFPHASCCVPFLPSGGDGQVTGGYTAQLHGSAGSFTGYPLGYRMRGY